MMILKNSAARFYWPDARMENKNRTTVFVFQHPLRNRLEAGVREDPAFLVKKMRKTGGADGPVRGNGC